MRYEIIDMRFGYKQQSSAEAELCVSILNTQYSVLNTQYYFRNNNSLNLGKGHFESSTNCSSLSTW
jgi:hypothetical protein